MATTITQPAAPAQMETRATASRLTSLDAYRGFIMLLLVSEGFGVTALKNHSGWSWLAAQFDHSEWIGCTFWDLIQPAFTFMVGVSMPFAFRRRTAEGAEASAVFRHVIRRALVLILLSNIYSNWGSRSGVRLQFINVLCQIAFGYVLCYGITRMRFRKQVAAAIVLLGGFAALFVLFPGPDGPWSKTGNIGAVVDLKLLGYNYSGYYTTINFIGNAVTILFGCWAGALLLSSRTHAFKLKTLGTCAVAAFALGLGLQPFIPMVKRLWTDSFTFFSTGWVLLMLLAFYWVIDVRQVKRWTFPFLVLGTNSMFVYSLGQIGIKGWLNRGLQGFTGNFQSLGDFGAIAQQMLVLTGLWAVCYWLYRRKIFFKV